MAGQTPAERRMDTVTIAQRVADGQTRQTPLDMLESPKANEAPASPANAMASASAAHLL